ncbi:Hypothetical protein NTJ_11450 [Nesidiocoris tenuis]|uniref:Odorant receptor n=1 Tax=Nesidiocoris tenuis TaxID=355587 RepID=A0ABN7B2I4_9HEMI|nr:Hypothetical protein NTJ_11450 [Nesidiocoris tenuis]
MEKVVMTLGAGSKNLGFTKQTMEEEDIRFLQLSGMYRLSKPYNVFFKVFYVFGLISFVGVIATAFIDGDSAVTFETTHLLLIISNMFIQSTVHLRNHETVDKLFRAIDRGFYSYGSAMDNETAKQIEKLRLEKKKRKRVYSDVFKYLVVGAALGIITKTVILNGIMGKENREMDGANWVIYYSPTRNWVPFAEYWIPYLFGMALSMVNTASTGMTAISSVAIFVRFAEEFCHQLDIISLGLNNVTRRAQFLYETRYGHVYSKGGSEESKIKYDNCLKECMNKTVEHHVVIIDLFAGFKQMMLIPLFTVIFDGSALIFLATALLISDEGNSIKLVIPIFMTAEIFYTYVYCGYGELLTRKFQEIGSSLYLDEWIDHTEMLKPYFTIITAYTFIPKRLSAVLTSPNNESFGSVLRTAYSLLNLLLNRGRTRAM